jgi:hypothetical protein
MTLKDSMVPSDLFFHNFLERNNLLLDYNYEKILLLYNNESLNSLSDYGEYKDYFEIFSNYKILKKKIYILYYILILFLINEELLRNFCRYVISIYSRFNYLKDNKCCEFGLLINNMNKSDLLNMLNKILNSENLPSCVSSSNECYEKPELSSNESTKDTLNSKCSTHNSNLFIPKFFILLLSFQTYF